MPLVTTDILMRDFRIDASVNADSLQRMIDVAEADIKTWVGASVYADAIFDNPADAGRAAKLKLAAEYLAISYALPMLNGRITSYGLVKESSIESGEKVKYLTPAELAQAKQSLFEQARSFADDYLADETHERPTMFALATAKAPSLPGVPDPNVF